MNDASAKRFAETLIRLYGDQLEFEFYLGEDNPDPFTQTFVAHGYLVIHDDRRRTMKVRKPDPDKSSNS